MLDVAFLRETTKFVSVGLSKKAPRDPLPLPCPLARYFRLLRGFPQAPNIFQNE